MKEPQTIEEELAIIAAALDAGIDPFPPRKESKKEKKARKAREKQEAELAEQQKTQLLHVLEKVLSQRSVHLKHIVMCLKIQM